MSICLRLEDRASRLGTDELLASEGEEDSSKFLGISRSVLTEDMFRLGFNIVIGFVLVFTAETGAEMDFFFFLFTASKLSSGLLPTSFLVKGLIDLDGLVCCFFWEREERGVDKRDMDIDAQERDEGLSFCD